jgi:hypothetical protein
MKLKSLLLIGALTFAGSAFGLTREFTIDKPVACGNVQLAPGTYKVRVRGNTAEIVDLNHFVEKKPIALAATVQRGDQKFDRTAVKTTNDGSIDRATEIDLSHSHTALEFQ